MRNVPPPIGAVDQWLEAGLRQALEPLGSENLRVPVARYGLLAERRGAGRRQRVFVGGASALALAAFGAVGAAAATTGSLDTSVWGQHISDAVQTCRDQLGAGEHGIGPCISAIASSKNDSAGHRQDGSRNSEDSETPAVQASPPGHGGTPPGQDERASGQGATPPGQGGTAPGESRSAEPRHSPTPSSGPSPHDPGAGGVAPHSPGTNP